MGKKAPFCNFVRRDHTCEVLAETSTLDPPTVISRHGLPTEYVRKTPDEQCMFLSPAFSHKSTQADPFHLFVTLSRVSGMPFRKQIPKRLLVLDEPYKVWCGVWDPVREANHRSSGDSTEVPCCRFEIRSKFKEP